jgi:endonuclease/exonuclease/phosphatase family metal-dependent hydrolase
MRLLPFVSLVALAACTGAQDTEDTDLPGPLVFTAAALNVESGGSDAASVAEDTVAPIVGEAIFAFEEVENDAAAQLLVAAVNDGDQDIQYRFGTTGYDDHLVLAWDEDQFVLTALEELHDLNIPNGTVRSPLVGTFEARATGLEFLFVVNHLWRTDDNARHEQAELLNAWGAAQTLPIVTMGDFNFDWNVDGSYHDEGYDRLVENDVFRWVRPPDPLIKSQCSSFYESVLDFAFVGGAAREWEASSAILRQEDDYCRGARASNYSDHRPITATFTVPD